MDLARALYWVHDCHNSQSDFPERAQCFRGYREDLVDRYLLPAWTLQQHCSLPAFLSSIGKVPRSLGSETLSFLGFLPIIGEDPIQLRG